jgi:DNA-binding transcriptional ArsR family regulator
VLEREGLVRRVREGKKVFFRLRDDDTGVKDLLEWVITRTTPDRRAESSRTISPAGNDVHRQAYVEYATAGAAVAAASIAPGEPNEDLDDFLL